MRSPLVLSTLLLAAACSTPTRSKLEMDQLIWSTAPHWVSMNGHYEVDDTPECTNSRFGVGVSKGIRNDALRRVAAVQAARLDLRERMRRCWSKQLEGKSPLKKDIADEAPKMSDKQALNKRVDSAANAAVVVENWQYEETAYVYLEVK